MRVHDISPQYIAVDKNNTISISQATLDRAKELTDETHKALIYDDKVIALSEETIKELHHAFTGDIQRYEDVFIATNQASSYLNKIVDFVMQDLNVQNADKNSDGVLTMAEGLEAKSILINNQIKKPSDVLSPQEINRFQHDQTLFTTVNNIIDENIKLDKDKDGNVTIEEIKSGLAKPADDEEKSPDLLETLYKQLAKAQGQLRAVSTKDDENSQEEMANLQVQVSSLMSQILSMQFG